MATEIMLRRSLLARFPWIESIELEASPYVHTLHVALAASAADRRRRDRNRVAVGFWMQALLPFREPAAFGGWTGGRRDSDLAERRGAEPAAARVGWKKTRGSGISPASAFLAGEMMSDAEPLLSLGQRRRNLRP